MSLLLAPYNTAMRLGQGFNSYTQQICVDDAVVVDPARAENVVTNDGTTMRIIAQLASKPSAWNRQQEVISDSAAKKVIAKLKHDAGEAVDDTPEVKEDEDDDVGEPEEEQDEAQHSEPKEPDTADTVAEPSDATTKKDSAPAGASKAGKSAARNQSTATPKTKPVNAIKPVNGDTKAKTAQPPNVKARVPTPKRKETPSSKQQDQDAERKRLDEQRKLRDDIEKENRDEERRKRIEDRAEQRQIREEKRQWESQRRKEAQKAISDAANANAQALTLADLAKIKAQNQFADRFSGMDAGTEKYQYDPTAAKGPSQTVVYSSKFIDRLSDITDDMSISGALSIKAAKIGGSGRGSFVDSDKFKDSDLKFYISVKVTNQTLNFKDALVYNPMSNIQGKDFAKVYGDSFISGFVEGGEFNALVSMKVLNKAKMTDIQAQAKVALTAGPVGITAEANVGIARSNIETNTETTIQVSWCGGGRIKPMEQPWNIESIMQAAARFPDLVAECPQRTYAILTKYDSLRSFVASKPAAYTKMQYENAQLYTNALMDSFMSYKAMYKLAGEQIDSVKRKLLTITPWDGTEAADVTADDKRFEDSVAGIADARVAMRKQMTSIVNEVDKIEEDPTLASKPERAAPYQSPTRFETRMPELKVPPQLAAKKIPLDGKYIGAKPQSEDQFLKDADQDTDESAASLLPLESKLLDDEKEKITQLEKIRPGLRATLAISDALGKHDKAYEWFNNLDFVQDSWRVTAVQVELYRGAVVAVEVSYDNGIFLRKGQIQEQDKTTVKLDNFRPGERIVSASIECGNDAGRAGDTRITAIRLYTNRGRKLLGQATSNVVMSARKCEKDGVMFDNIATMHLDVPIEAGTFKGFFGWTSRDTPKQGLPRIGVIWGSSKHEQAIVSDERLEYEAPAFSGAQSGQVAPARWSATDVDISELSVVTFPNPYQTKPRLLVGLGSYHTQLPTTLVSKTQITEVRNTGFNVAFSGGGNKPWTEPRMNWLTLPENEIHFEHGYFDTSGLPQTLVNSETKVTNRQYFQKPFKNDPWVYTWIINMNVPEQAHRWHCFSTGVAAKNKDYFDLYALSWAERKFTNARIGWLAFDDTGVENRADVFERSATRERPWVEETLTLPAGYKKAPKVLIVPYAIDAEAGKPLQMSSNVLSTSTTSATVQYGTRNTDTSNITALRYWIIAIE